MRRTSGTPPILKPWATTMASTFYLGVPASSTTNYTHVKRHAIRLLQAYTYKVQYVLDPSQKADPESNGQDQVRPTLPQLTTLPVSRSQDKESPQGPAVHPVTLAEALH